MVCRRRVWQIMKPSLPFFDLPEAARETRVIVLLVGGAVALGIGADALAAGAQGAWQPLVTGAVAMACLPAALLTLRRMWRRV
jgi:hypothetical protein